MHNEYPIEFSTILQNMAIFFTFFRYHTRDSDRDPSRNFFRPQPEDNNTTSWRIFFYGSFSGEKIWRRFVV